MSPSLQQWKSDPLFSAAEIVQDSADRMESIFRLLLHELSVAQSENSGPKPFSSVNCHRRDLATILETTKWQLEDFQRAVSSSQRKGDEISRHMQFIRAIRDHVIRVEKSLEDWSFGDPVRNDEWVNLNEEDKNRLALFLSGGDPTKESENDISRRFLDSGTESSAAPRNGERDDDAIAIEALNVGSWDLEANESDPKSFSEVESKLRRFRRSKAVGFFVRFWTVYVCRLAGNYTKRLKDGEERSESPSSMDGSNVFRNWVEMCGARYRMSINQIRLDRHYVWFIALVILVLLVLGILVLGMA